MEHILQKMNDRSELNYKIINCKVKYIRTQKCLSCVFLFFLKFFLLPLKGCVVSVLCDVLQQKNKRDQHKKVHS
jgi:hypothetical protein